MKSAVCGEKPPWRLMLAVNAAVLVGVFPLQDHAAATPTSPYIHLLADYHFGFTNAR